VCSPAKRVGVVVLLAGLCAAADDAKSLFHRRDLVFQNYIDDATLSPDGARFAVALEVKAGNDEHRSRLELWDFSAGKLADKTYPPSWRGLPQVRLHFSGDGKSLLFYDGNGTLHVLDDRLSEVRQFDIGLANEDVQKLNEAAAHALPGRIEPLPVRPPVVMEMAVAPKGSLVAVRFVTHELSQMIHIFDFVSGQQVRSWGQPTLQSGSGPRTTWDPAGEYLALGFGSEVVHEGQRGDVLVYDVPSGTVVHHLVSGFKGVVSVAFAGNDQLVVAPAHFVREAVHELRMVNFAGELQKTFTVPQSGLSNPFTVSSDGRRLVALASRVVFEGDPPVARPLDTRLVLWDIGDSQPKAITPDLWPVKFPRLAISSDGRRILAGRHYDTRRLVLLELIAK
jgi:WD40 repeat protein